MYNPKSVPATAARSAPPSTPSAADVARLLVDALKRRNGSALGTELASLTKASYPTLNWRDFQSHTFRDFVRSHAGAEIVEVGRQGGDVIYDLRSNLHVGPESALAASSSLPSDEREAVWRAFTSPNSTRAVTIQVNVSSGAWRVLELNAAAETNEWKTVSPLSPEDHRSIAADFVERHTEEPLRMELAQAIAAGGDKWWLTFREALRRHALDSRYREWRLTQIQSALRHSLERLGFRADTLTSAIRRALPAFVEKASAAAKSERQVAASPMNDELRRLAALIVEALPDEELRAIRVRLGDVLDALAKRS